jgi:hypothetical protein
MRATLLGATLIAALAVGAFLRLDGIGEPSFWIDEILHQILTTKSAAEPWWHWLTGFEPENGPLYYATQLATRAAGRSEGAARAAAALFGIAAIVFAWRASREDFGIAALLLAVAPLHVYYSREARPYALLMLLTAALIAVLLRGRSLIAALLLLLAMAYTAAASAPVLLGIAITCALLAWMTRERFYAIVAGASVIALGALPLLYRGASQHATGAVHLDAMTLLRNFATTALYSPLGGRAAIAMLVFALLGAFALWRRERRAAIVIIGMTALPLACALGALAYFGRWYAPRYVAPALIGYLLLAGAGIAFVARAARSFAPVIAAVIVIAFGWQSWAACRTEPWQKLDWRLITAKLLRYANKGDLVIAAEPWSGIPLNFYLQRQPRKVDDVTMPHLALAQRMATRKGTWLVTAGVEGSQVRDWMCQSPLVLASALDHFRMHYTGDFVNERAQYTELRAIAAGIGDAFEFGEGWASQEDNFRWALGEHATLIVPGSHPIRVSILPFFHASLPPQRVRISINGRFVQEQVLHEGWQDVQIEGGTEMRNTITLDFARANSPASVNPASGDPRRLAAAVADPRAPLVQTRIAAPRFLDENTAWRNTHTRFTHLNEANVKPLLGRLGFDPDSTWPRLARGELHLDDLVESVAYGSDCEDETTFVRHAFTLLLNRPPGDAELRSLLGIARVRVAGRIAKSEEFTKRMTAVPAGAPHPP